MPHIVDYDIVLQQLTGEGLRCNYHNSGAFGFAPEAQALVRGWIGPSDSTIRSDVRTVARQVPPPYEHNLSTLAVRAWVEDLPCSVWLMPTSHWSFELIHGSHEWLPDLLRKVDIDPAMLAPRANAAAIEFAIPEATLLATFLEGLLSRLTGSDFILAFVGRRTVCTVHHHKQMWWWTAESDLVDKIDRLLDANAL